MRTLRSMGFLVLFFALLALPMKSFAQFSLRVTIAPPELVVYTQPVCPQEGYLWTPGYWAYSSEGYFWVPGTWVEPPTVGDLWTPGYWGWDNGAYLWNEGYWGTEVGFYGGVNYGFGYGGEGYQGGQWRNNQFSYNIYVSNVGPRGNFHNTYNQTVTVNNTVRVSYNGGNGGIRTRPSAEQQSFAHASHAAPTAAQSNHQRAASQNREELASVNHGAPPIAATSKPGEFTGNNVVPARGARGGNTPAGNAPGGNATDSNRPAGNGGSGNRTNAGNAATPGGTQNRPNDNGGAVNRATNKNAAEIKPATEPAAAPVRSAPAPRGQNAPRPADQQPQQNQRQPQQQRQQPQAQQHQAAPSRDSAPRGEGGRPNPGNSKSDKSDGR
jgi:hypothetical protein